MQNATSTVPQTTRNRNRSQVTPPESPSPALSLDHWTRHSTPQPQYAAAVAAPYEDATSRHSPELAAVTLDSILARIMGTGPDKPPRPWTVIVAELDGLFQIIRHNPHFQEEAEALRLLVHSDYLLSQFSFKVNSL